ncbi:MAG: C39 family peptidase [Candidatus Doudnabacteria bacterium]
MNKHLKVKSFQETLNAGMCGPASLKILLSYYGIKRDEKELADLCGTKKGLGTDDQGIKRVAESLGFKVKIKNNSSFKDIERWLDKDVPIIVNWFTRGRADYTDADVPDGHYSVVCGIDDQSIYLQDPEIGRIRKIKKNDFKRVWFDFSGELIKPNELIIMQMIAIYK